MTERFDTAGFGIEGPVLVTRKPRGDERGFFSRFFCADELAAVGWPSPVAQINHSLTGRKGTVRGLHFQRPPSAECKYVSCLKGAILDVAVDIREGSPTFLGHVAVELSAGNQRSLIVPEGFAHGFQALTDDAEILYIVSAPYSPADEDGLHPLDPGLSLDWPLPVEQLSQRDSARPFLDARFSGIRLD